MLKKLKTVSLSILPLVVFVVLLHVTVQEFTSSTLISFFVGAIILIVGQAVFLTGIEKSIEPMGEYVGNSVSNNKRFIVYLIFGFVFGVFATVAEPDMQVFAGRVAIAGFNISKTSFIVVAGVGVGFAVSLALIKIVLKWNIKIVLLVSYIIVFVLGIFISESALSMSMDAGANTTGVVTSPFLLSLGIGFSRVTGGSRDSSEDSFGLIALSSVGPIIAVEILCLFSMGNGAVISSTVESSLPLWISVLIDVAFSILPLVIVFFVFEFFFIKISKQEKKKLLLGTAITFVGFYLFLFGIEFGLTKMGEEFGKVLKLIDSETIVLIIMALLGFSIVFSEPSIRILARQIEDVTNRNIKKGLVIVAIAISVMISISLCVLKIYYEFSIWWIIGIVFGLTGILMIFVPKLFVSIAFDSSGVATGTLTTAFVFPIMIGLGGNLIESFGAVAIMSMTPILVFQILGLLYRIIVQVEKNKTNRLLVSLSRTEDKYSNIEKLKIKHEKEFNLY